MTATVKFRGLGGRIDTRQDDSHKTPGRFNVITAVPACRGSASAARSLRPRRFRRRPGLPFRRAALIAVFLIGPAAISFTQTNVEGRARNFEYLRGKTASYRLNAYVDYRIATHILRFVETGSEPSGPEEAARRARRFMEDLPRRDGHPKERQRLLVRAFTVRHLNGYADLMWARFIERANRVPPVHVEPHYGKEAEEGPIDLFFWTYLLRGSVAPVADFVEPHVAFTLSDQEVAEEIAHVQEANSGVNQQIVAAIRRAMEEGPGGAGELSSQSQVEKVEILLRYASASPYPADFLRGAIAAQRGARRWDGAFRRLLRWRF
jgi:hypothetical protein